MVKNLISNHTNHFKKNINIKSVLVNKNFLNESNPIISIVIPTYNRTELIESINSAINQLNHTMNYEILVIDNNHSFSVIDSIKNNYPNKNIYFYKNSSNLGMVGNWNRAVELSKGKWISFLHDDDLLDSYYLSNIQKMLDKYKNIDIILSNSITFVDSKKIINNPNKNKIKKFLIKNQIMKSILPLDTYITNMNPYGVPSCGLLINRKVIIQEGGFDENLFPYHDWHFLLKLNLKYSVFRPFFITGFYRWAINESLNPRTLIKFVNDAEKFRLISKKSFIGKIVYYLFREEQNYIHIKNILKIDKNFLILNKNEINMIPIKRPFRLRFYLMFKLFYSLIRNISIFIHFPFTKWTKYASNKN